MNLPSTDWKAKPLDGQRVITFPSHGDRLTHADMAEENDIQNVDVETIRTAFLSPWSGNWGRDSAGLGTRELP
ncbi:MAG: hypothetical protein OXF74_00025 [Rhodobacteraceae bacterium]|nr:hypothetical protein [Paracoccaceae bacterium]